MRVSLLASFRDRFGHYATRDGSTCVTKSCIPTPPRVTNSTTPYAPLIVIGAFHIHQMVCPLLTIGLCSRKHEGVAQVRIGIQPNGQLEWSRCNSIAIWCWSRSRGIERIVDPSLTESVSRVFRATATSGNAAKKPARKLRRVWQSDDGSGVFIAE